MARRDKAVFVISVAAELAGMHPQTLRVYERRGLIEPYRTPGGTRRYSQDDIDRLSLISDLTEQGLTLEGVRRVLEMRNQIDRLQAKVAKLESEVESLVEETERRLRAVRDSMRHEIVVRRSSPPDIRR